MKLNTFLLLFLLAVCQSVSGTYVEDQTKLLEDLFSGYRKDVLPKKPVDLSVGVAITHFDVDEKHNQLILHSWLKYWWLDPRLQWDPRDYGGITTLRVDPNIMWRPDVALYNSGNPENVEICGDTLALIYHNDTALHVPPCRLVAKCVYDLTDWPNDIQYCKAKLGSWTYDGKKINLQTKSKDIELELTKHADSSSPLADQSTLEWEILHVNLTREEKYYDCCTEPYPSISIHLKLQRNGPAHYWDAQLPAMVLSVLTVTVFILPPGMGAKLLIASIGFLLQYHYLHYIEVMIAHAPTHTPTIVRFLGGEMILTIFALVISAIFLRILSNPSPSPVPQAILKLLNLLASFLGLSSYKVGISQSAKREAVVLNSEEGNDLTATPQADPAVAQWTLFVAVIDRILLIIYSVIMVIDLITIF